MRLEINYRKKLGKTPKTDMLMKEMEYDTNRWKDTLLGLEDSILSKLLYYPKQCTDSVQSLTDYQ